MVRIWTGDFVDHLGACNNFFRVISGKEKIIKPDKEIYEKVVEKSKYLPSEILFFDEPSAGLDPVSSRRLDDLILQLRESLGATIVVVTHELPSIFAIGTNAIFLDPETKTKIAEGAPKDLLEHCEDPKVHRFLTRSSN